MLSLNQKSRSSCGAFAAQRASAQTGGSESLPRPLFCMVSVSVRVTSSEGEVGRRGTANPLQLGQGSESLPRPLFAMESVGVRATSSEREVGRRGTANRYQLG